MFKKFSEIKNRIIKNKNVYRITAVLVFVSIIIILLNNQLRLYFPESILVNDWVSPVLVFLGTSVISYAIGQVILSLFDIIDFVQKRISEVFFTDKFIRLLNDEKKNEIKTEIEKELYNTNNDAFLKFSNSFDEAVKLPENDMFYKKFTNMVNCDIVTIGEKNYRQITNIRTIVYGKKRNDYEFQLEEVIKYNYIDIPELKKKQIFSLEKVVLCSDNQTKRELPFYSETLTNTDTKFNNSIYNKTAIGKLREPILIEENTRIEIRYTVIEPLTDHSYVTRLDRFCHDFSVNFTYNKEAFDVSFQAFGFGLVPYSNKKNIKKLDNHINIGFSGPSFPGDGTVFTVIPKNS